MNWNRTSAHQIWGKFSYMNAVVDDLTNYLGPDPNATGDGGFTKVYQATARPDLDAAPTMLMDMTFGFGRQNQDVLGPDFQAGNYGLDVLGIPGTNDQGIGDERYAGYPQFEHRLQRRRQPRRLEPDLPRRAHLLAGHQLTKVKGRHDFRGGYLVNFLYLDHWQPETGNPRGQLRLQRQHHGAQRRPDARNFYNQYAAFLLGLRRHGRQERAERADDGARVAARASTSATAGRQRAS